jgi:hypothetical protein
VESILRKHRAKCERHLAPSSTCRQHTDLPNFDLTHRHQQRQRAATSVAVLLAGAFLGMIEAAPDGSNADLRPRHETRQLRHVPNSVGDCPGPRLQARDNMRVCEPLSEARSQRRLHLAS